MIRPSHRRYLVSALFLLIFGLAPISRAQSDPDSPVPAQAAVPLPPEVQPTPLQTAPTGALTVGERLDLELKLNFGPANFIVPAYEAGFRMADPPHAFPHDWRDGFGGFARNYGADFALTTTAGFGRFTADAIVGHDPRYYPSTSPRAGRRFLHALAFTLADNTDSGHRSFAFGNFAGAAAAAGASMAMYPHGFNDFTHAGQRFDLQIANFAAHNLFAEFAPEVIRLAHAIHIPDRFAGAFLPADRKQR
jgi:hypothetical protein